MASTVWKGQLAFGLVSFPVKLFTAARSDGISFNQLHKADGSRVKQVIYCAAEDAGEKPYALLFNTLKQTGYVGVAKIAMHNREHIVIFRPGPQGLMMHTMYYANEVRKVDEFRTDVTLVKDKEVELARMLVESLAATFEPEKYHDTYRDNLQSMIDAKIKGKEVVTPPSREPAKIIDIMEALKQSLASRKPAASTADVSGAAEADSKPKKRTARGKS